MRWACSAALAVLMIACGGSGALSGGAGATPPAGSASGSHDIAFAEVLTTTQAAHDSGPTLVVAATASSQSTLARLVRVSAPPQDRVLIAAFQGEQRTGGYAIQITKIEHDGDRLTVHATFTVPPADAMTTQVITSPAHVVSARATDIAGARVALLLDEKGEQRAQVNIS